MTFLINIRSHELVDRKLWGHHITILRSIFPRHMSNRSTNSAFANTSVLLLVFMPVKLGSPFAFLWYDYRGSLICLCN